MLPIVIKNKLITDRDMIEVLLVSKNHAILSKLLPNSDKSEAWTRYQEINRPSQPKVQIRFYYI